MSSVPSKIILQFTDPEKSIDWKKHEEIVWIKSPKSSVKDLNPLEREILINFEETPFSTIHILQNIGSEFEYVDSEERISKLDLNERIKEEWADSLWFVQPKKELKYPKRISLEILTRLIRIFSKENEVILDPFTGFGGTVIICKKYNRNFLCLDKDKKKINQVLKKMRN